MMKGARIDQKLQVTFGIMIALLVALLAAAILLGRVVAQRRHRARRGPAPQRPARWASVARLGRHPSAGRCTPSATPCSPRSCARRLRADRRRGRGRSIAASRPSRGSPGAGGGGRLEGDPRLGPHLALRGARLRPGGARARRRRGRGAPRRPGEGGHRALRRPARPARSWPRSSRGCEQPRRRRRRAGRHWRPAPPWRSSSGTFGGGAAGHRRLRGGGPARPAARAHLLRRRARRAAPRGGLRRPPRAHRGGARRGLQRPARRGQRGLRPRSAPSSTR